MCNNASLLWRLEYRGIDVGDRWHSLLEISETHTTDQELVFASLHYLLPLARLRSPKFEEMSDNFATWGTGNADQAKVSHRIGVPVAALLDGKPSHLDWQPSLHTVGGSHAQRELFGELV
ncbi:MAG: hypothetical protein GKR90_09570 [Pseudomonadales bacterium]|nr:hypothetical protein [Pseudomonadales bacterium]